MKKKILPMIILIAAVAGGSFYAGAAYSKSKSSTVMGQQDFSNFRNLSPEERTARMQEMGISGGGSRGMMGGTRNGESFISGEILSVDGQSVTIKLRDGGSKIVFYSDETEIGKFVTDGTAEDLQSGLTVTANGKVNEDGTITATSIQLRPEMANDPLRPEGIPEDNGEEKKTQ